MKIIIDPLHEGARRAKGLVILIDVLRFCTTVAYIFGAGAEKIYPVKEVHEALALKKQNPEYVLVGERKGFKLKGMDHGNSPSALKDKDLSGKIVVATTSNATLGISNAKKADELLLGNFVNMQATIDYIKKKNPEIVTIVPIGIFNKPAEEDELCAEFMKDLLEGKVLDFEKIKKQVINCPKGEKFRDKNHSEFPEEDLYLSVDINKFNFALKVIEEDGHLEIVKA